MLTCWAQGENTVVSLIMSRAAYTDSGNYTCAPDNAPLASIQLHIIDGTNPVLLHNGGSCNACTIKRSIT